MVKKQTFDTRQTFTLFHELGHLILDHDSSIDDEADFYSNFGNEAAANRFAGAVLVPDHFLEQVNMNAKLGDPRGYKDWLADPRRRWGVSTEVILRRLTDTGRLPREDYEGYRRLNKNRPSQKRAGRGNRGYRYREPMHIFGDGYVRTVFDALSAHKITTTRATSYLDNLKVKDLHRLEGHYAGI
jgi:Zn-dependent peptidase ImmA (M78 family)